MLRLAVNMVLSSLRRRMPRLAVTFAGVALAVAALVVLMAVMIGVGDAMVRNSVAIRNGHVWVNWPAKAPADGPQSIVDLTADIRSQLWRKRCEGVLIYGQARNSVTLFAIQAHKSGFRHLS